MKRYIIAIMALLTIVSCKDLVELNKDTKNPEEVPSGSLFANATLELFDFMTSTNVNRNNFRLWSQHWTQTTYTDESNYQLTERNVNGAAYVILYSRVLRDLEEARVKIEEDEFFSDAEKNAQYAMITVLKVYTYHVLVDIFGDVPYSEALGDEVTPAYDDDQFVYNSIIDELDAAIPNLVGNSGMGGFDLIYGGDADMWRKAANTLKLRLAMRIADVDGGKSQTLAEQAVNDGVISSPAENMALNYQSSTPHTNPLWDDLVQSGRTDFVASNTLTDIMNDLNDPRSDDYFRGPFDSLGNLIGGVYGASNDYYSNSQPGNILEDPTLPGVLLSHTETEFLLADAAARNYAVGGTAEDHYEHGITASILYWGGTQAEADAYIAQPEVAWDPAEWRELIGTQKWIAMYNRGFEAWATWKLYDAPQMNLAFGAGTVPPLRYSYPVDEYSLNEANVTGAADNFNNNDMYWPIFWDVN